MTSKAVTRPGRAPVLSDAQWDALCARWLLSRANLDPARVVVTEVIWDEGGMSACDTCGPVSPSVAVTWTWVPGSAPKSKAYWTRYDESFDDLGDAVRALVAFAVAEESTEL